MDKRGIKSQDGNGGDQSIVPTTQIQDMGYHGAEDPCARIKKRERQLMSLWRCDRASMMLTLIYSLYIMEDLMANICIMIVGFLFGVRSILHHSSLVIALV